MYFITICIAERRRVLGQVERIKSVLNEIGLLVEYCWRDTDAENPLQKAREGTVCPCPYKASTEWF